MEKVAFFFAVCYNERMKREKTPTSAKVFKIKFSLPILFMIAAVYLLCVLGIIVSVWRIVKFGIHDFGDVIKYPFLIAVCILCIVLVTAILCKSCYKVEKGALVTQFGFIKTSYAVKDIHELTLDCDTKKLTVSFHDGQYMTLTVNMDWNEELVREIMNANPDIDYSFTLAEAPEHKHDEEKK